MGASISPQIATNPHVQDYLMRHSLESAVAQAKQQYPRLAKWPVKLTIGTGRGGSETYPPDEDFNPNPGMWTVQLRDPAVIKHREQWPDTVGLESLHWLQATDPKYQQFTKDFIKSMSEPQRRATHWAYLQDKKRSPEDTPAYDEWLTRVQAQEYIRGGVFTKAIPNWIGPKGEGQYTPQQMKLMNQIKQYLQTSEDR